MPLDSSDFFLPDFITNEKCVGFIDGNSIRFPVSKVQWKPDFFCKILVKDKKVKYPGKQF